MSVYDIPLKSVDGQDNFLNQFKGKVSLFINVTGDCGNAPQFVIIETLYKKYKDQGFEVIAIPTNDYCGVGSKTNLTYGDHVYGTGDAVEAQAWAKEIFNVTYPFAELVESNPGPEELIEGLPSKYGQVTPHEIFAELGQQAASLNSTGVMMHGNFEKYLVGKDGKLIKHYANNRLLSYNYDKAIADNLPIKNLVPGDEAYAEICKDIEAALAS